MKIYLIDTFTDTLFQGSPAVVAVMEQWPSDRELLLLARENAVPESAFLVRQEDRYHIRWFTHQKEISLCGHATLAAAYVVNQFLEPNCQTILFHSLAGEITVACRPSGLFEMSFSAFNLQPADFSDALREVVGVAPKQVYLGRDYLLVYGDEQTVRSIQPNWREGMNFGGKLISVTARGQQYDCVSRTFVPHNRMAEEEACGSAHCHIIPYWSRVTGKKKLRAFQASSRGGLLFCSYEDGKVLIAGSCALYLTGETAGPLSGK